MKITTVLSRIILGLILIVSASTQAMAKLTNQTKSTPIDSAIGKLENQLKNNAPPSEIEKTAAEILTLKKNSPIFYIPELNYLLDKNVEKIPQSQTAIFRKRIFQIDTILSGITAALVILGAFSLIYFADKVLQSEIRRNTAILLGSFLILLSIVVQGSLFYGVFGALAGLGFISRRKIPISILMLLLILFHLSAKTVNRELFKTIASPKNQLIDKLNRDNYSPYFLISQSKLSQNERQITLIANKQALLHEIDINTWKNLLTNNLPSEEKAIVLNNIGCILFNKNKLTEAAEYFRKAEELYPLQKIYFNLFITYSSLLEPQKAEIYSKKLTESNYMFQKETPLVANIGDIYKISLKVNIPFKSIAILMAVFIISSIAAARYVKKLPLISINPVFKYLPGYSFYYNDNYPGILLLIIGAFVIETIVRTLCLTNL